MIRDPYIDLIDRTVMTPTNVYEYTTIMYTYNELLHIPCE